MSQTAFLADIRQGCPELDPHGFVIHGAIHEAKPDIARIIRPHSLARVAISTMRRFAGGLDPSCKH